MSDPFMQFVNLMEDAQDHLPEGLYLSMYNTLKLCKDVPSNVISPDREERLLSEIDELWVRHEILRDEKRHLSEKLKTEQLAIRSQRENERKILTEISARNYINNIINGKHVEPEIGNTVKMQINLGDFRIGRITTKTKRLTTLGPNDAHMRLDMAPSVSRGELNISWIPVDERRDALGQSLGPYNILDKQECHYTVVLNDGTTIDGVAEHSLFVIRDNYVTNPLSGRRIKAGGSTHMRLKRNNQM